MAKGNEMGVVTFNRIKKRNPGETAQFLSLEQLYALNSYKSNRNQVGAGFAGKDSKNG